jgi:hypothetical protein
MAWEVVKREDNSEGSDEAFVSIAHKQITFSAQFVRVADLNANIRVIIHTDTQSFKLGFEFCKEDRPNSYALIPARPGEKGLNCSAKALVRKFDWIRSVANLSPKYRRFEPKQENTPIGKLWSIQLCPAFEERRARESKDIPSNARGIYRYVTEGGEIVYIGRGDISTRLKSPERQAWQFDIVEYSIVDDPDQQVRWEAYWIDRYKDDHKGKFPVYNKVSGASSSPETAT